MENLHNIPPVLHIVPAAGAGAGGYMVLQTESGGHIIPQSENAAAARAGAVGYMVFQTESGGHIVPQSEYAAAGAGAGGYMALQTGSGGHIVPQSEYAVAGAGAGGYMVPQTESGGHIVPQSEYAVAGAGAGGYMVPQIESGGHIVPQSEYAVAGAGAGGYMVLKTGSGGHIFPQSEYAVAGAGAGGYMVPQIESGGHIVPQSEYAAAGAGAGGHIVPQSEYAAAGAGAGGSNRLKNMRKKEMKKQVIDLIKKKNRGKSLDPDDVIADKFYDVGPDEYVGGQNGEEVPRLFFTLRKPCFRGSIRACRQAGGGTWKQNCLTIEIQHGDEGLIGYERYYEFWKDKDGKKTCWRLIEYEEHNPLLSRANQIKNCYVFCKLYKVSGESRNNNGEGRVGKRKRSQHEEERVAKRLDDTINHHPEYADGAGGNRVPQFSYAAGAGSNMVPPPEYAAGAGGNMAPQSEDHYKLTEYVRLVQDSDEWINVSFEGFDDLIQLDEDHYYLSNVPLDGFDDLQNFTDYHFP